jgi:hypothetical protein
MLLELSKALSFMASIMSLYWLAANAFFASGVRWEDRLIIALAKLAIATCICFFSGLLFRWPSHSNPDAGQSLTSTLPVQLFFWVVGIIVVLFAASWWMTCGAYAWYNHDYCG